MSNIISGKTSANKCRIEKCCCCNLRIGTLIISWFTLVTAVLWLVVNILDSLRGKDFALLIIFDAVNVILDVIIVTFIFLGIYQGNVKVIWASVFVTFVCPIWYLVGFIAFFLLGYLWLDVVGVIIMVPLKIYFFLVLRSYAYEVSSLEQDNGAI